MLGFYLTCVIFVFVVLGLAAQAGHRAQHLLVLRYLGREFLLILSTSSSESALPRLIAKMEHVGVSRPVVGITVPTGYSFNLDGTAIYLTMASLFIADALGKPLAVGEQIAPAALHDHRLEGRGRGDRRRAGHAGRRPAVAPARPGRRRRADRRHRPVHVGGPGADQLRRQRRGHVLVGNWAGEFDRDRAQAVLHGEDPFDEATMLDDEPEKEREPVVAAQRTTTDSPSRASEPI